MSSTNLLSAGGLATPFRSIPIEEALAVLDDGHTLAPALEQVEILTGTRQSLAVVDRGYRGHGVETTRVLINGLRRGITPTLVKILKRRSAIEPQSDT